MIKIKLENILRRSLRNLPAYFRLVRWKNLLLLAFSLAVVRYGIILRFVDESPNMQNISHGVFLLMALATLFIAAAGYIINDFYDLKIDLLNKPSRMILGRMMSTTRGIILYILLNGAGLAAGLGAALKAGQPSLFLLFLFTASLLWYYSVFLKRNLLWGNLTVAFLAALAVIMPLAFEFYLLLENPDEWARLFRSFRLAIRFTLALAVFAFLLTLIREILKDVEDMKGDAAENCRTLPLVLGWPRTRDILSALILLTIILLGIAQYYLSQSAFRWAFFWYFVPQFLLIHLFSRLPEQPVAERIATATRIAKAIMLVGVAGIIFLFP
ncbi:MAG: geranylgeranylglycerol-phosphate geranylgeranyltransferase [Bacteroidales bacterium]